MANAQPLPDRQSELSRKPLRVLMVEDSVDDAELVQLELTAAGYNVSAVRVDNEGAMRLALENRDWDVVIADYAVPGFGSVPALKLLKQAGRDIPFIIFSGSINDETAVASMRAGAHDYVLKDNIGRLVPAIERELQEAAIRKQKNEAESTVRYLSAIVQSSEDAIVGKTLDGTITSWNRGAERLYGYSTDEIIGKSISALLVPDQADQTLELMRRVATGEGVENYETVRRRKDGTLVEISLSLSPIRDAGGEVVGIAAIGRDISERKRTEKALRESENRFRALVTTSAQALYCMSPDWSEMRWLRGGRFIADNDDPSTSWLQKYIAAEDQTEVWAAVQRAVATRSLFELEHRVRRADGTLGWTLSRAVPMVNSSGEITEWFGAAIDVTAQKQAQEALIRSEKLAATGRLAATIAHEINNPLESMVNLVYLLRRSVTDSAAREHLELLDKQIGTLTHISTQTLKFHRENGQPVGYRISEIVAELLEFYEPKAMMHGVNVSSRLETEGRLFGFIGEIRQVISNLLINAIEATPARGKITVHLYESADWRGGRRGYRLSIVDTGSGIDRSHRARIFEPFFTTKGEKGTGLGLWVSMGIVNRAGGTMHVWSTQHPGRSGTCFSVFLPAELPVEPRGRRRYEATQQQTAARSDAAAEM